MVVHSVNWPDVSCNPLDPLDPVDRASVHLANVVTQALAQNPPNWVVIYLAGWCAIKHTMPPGIPIPPAKTACGHAKAASAAATPGPGQNWATVASELNHGGSQPLPGGGPSAGTARPISKPRSKPKPKLKPKLKKKRKPKRPVR